MHLLRLLRRRLPFLLAGALAAPAFAAAPAAAAAAEPIKVGQIASLTGKEAAFGQSSNMGTVLAVEEINQAGGVLGRTIQLVTEDNRSVQGESATATRKLISRDGVVALLGEVASGRSMEMAPVAQRARIPMISPSATNPRVTEMGDYIFRVCFIDPFQGEVMARFAHETLRVKRVAVLTDAAAPYSVGLAEYFTRKFKALGGEITMERRFQGGDKDFRAQLTAIRGSNPDAIFVPSYYTEAGLITRQARQMGLTVPIFGGDGWEAPQLLEIGGEAMEGTFYSTHFSPQNQDANVQDFVKRFQARWGREPDAMAALGYDSAMVLFDAIRRAGTTEGPKLRDALARTTGFPGATGKTTIDEKRNARKSAVIIAVRGGQFVFLKEVEP